MKNQPKQPFPGLFRLSVFNGYRPASVPVPLQPGNGTRDHATGRILHDDMVMSAALAVFETYTLPIRNHIEDLTEHYENLQKIYERRMRREMGPYWR